MRLNKHEQAFLVLNVSHQGMMHGALKLRAKLMQNSGTTASTWLSMQHACWQHIMRYGVTIAPMPAIGFQCPSHAAHHGGLLTFACTAPA
jgi:hypothetical protein